MQLFKRFWQAFDNRTNIPTLIGEFMRHPVPPNVGWAYVFGSATLFAFIIQVVTGIALAASYVPSTGQAYDSLQFISNQALFGHVLRGVHYFSASAMVLLIGIHAIRTFLWAAYKYPREVNWISGAILLALTVAMGFTGQLLRWDQNAVWSVVVAAEQAGRVPIIGNLIAKFILAGDTVNGVTLSRFFAFHVFFIPALIFAFIGLHLYLALHHGISEPPEEGRPVDPKTYRSWYENLIKTKGIPFWPDVAWRDTAFALGVVIVVVTLAIFFGAPTLGKPPDPSIIEASPHPDWYLLWIFALLALLPPGLENYFIVGGPLLTGAVLILLPFIAGKGERSLRRRPWAIGIVVLIVLMVGSLWYAGVKANWSPAFAAQALPASLTGSLNAQEKTGAQLFHDKGCEYCHSIAGYGGQRGPDLTDVGNRLTEQEMIIRISNGGVNMPPFAGNLTADEMNALVAFLKTRKQP